LTQEASKKGFKGIKKEICDEFGAQLHKEGETKGGNDPINETFRSNLRKEGWGSKKKKTKGKNAGRRLAAGKMWCEKPGAINRDPY